MRNFEYGKTDEQKEIGRHAMTQSDHDHRIEKKKVYPCTQCSEPLTIYEHVKYLFMCDRCAQQGEAHYNQEADGRVRLTNRNE